MPKDKRNFLLLNILPWPLILPNIPGVLIHCLLFWSSGISIDSLKLKEQKATRESQDSMEKQVVASSYETSLGEKHLFSKLLDLFLAI